MLKLLPVVNEKDEIISVKEKRSCDADDITRVTGLLVYNPKGEVLIAKRVATKYHDPGKWSHAVAGTVEEGETYVSNIIKESQEEIGLDIKSESLQEIYYGYFETSHKFFFRMYSVECPWPIEQFRLQAEEVAEVRWITKDELKEWAEDRPQDFVASFRVIQERIRDKY